MLTSTDDDETSTFLGFASNPKTLEIDSGISFELILLPVCTSQRFA